MIVSVRVLNKISVKQEAGVHIKTYLHVWCVTAKKKKSDYGMYHDIYTSMLEC